MSDLSGQPQTNSLKVAHRAILTPSRQDGIAMRCAPRGALATKARTLRNGTKAKLWFPQSPNTAKKGGQNLSTPAEPSQAGRISA